MTAALTGQQSARTTDTNTTVNHDKESKNSECERLNNTDTLQEALLSARWTSGGNRDKVPALVRRYKSGKIDLF